MSTRAGEFPPASEAGRYYFKAVARVGPRLVSIFDGKTEYIFGSTLAHRDIPNAKFPPGYYVCNSPEEAVTAAIPKTAALYVAPRIIIKCLAWGQITYHPVPGSQPPKNMIGKNTLVFTRIRPLEVIPIPLGAKNTKFSQRELTGIKLQYAREISPPFSATAGRNARPFQRSETDQRALRQNIVVMEEHLRKLIRRDLTSHTNNLTPGFNHLITQSQTAGMKRYLTNKGVDVSSVLAEAEAERVKAMHRQRAKTKAMEEEGESEEDTTMVSGDDDDHTAYGSMYETYDEDDEGEDGEGEVADDVFDRTHND